MSQQPKTETDRLANVIQVLQLGKKTGMLVVERNNGPHIEQGSITLVKGHITQASVGQRQGQEAMICLESWGHCRFSFSTKQRYDLAAEPGYLSSPRRSMGRGDGPSVNAALPITAPGPTYSFQQAVTRTTGNVGSNGPFTSTLWDHAPFRTRHIEEGLHLIERMGLSRAHRRLFLLIDGRRTLQDLIRLLTNEPADVYRLLKELERAGVVQA